MKPTCAIEGCEIESHARGWCKKHYRRWCRTGDPLAFRPPGRRGPRKHKSHCKFGHDLSGDNLRIRVRADGGITQVCKACSHESVDRVRARRRAGGGA